MTPCIIGFTGTSLSPDQAQAFRALAPAGYIVFSRNIVNPQQLRALTDSLRELHPYQPMIMVDQEGGKVQRLAPPHWIALPDAAQLGNSYKHNVHSGTQAMHAWGKAVASMLHQTGINTNAAPVADLPVASAHSVIGSRAYAQDTQQAIDLARLAMQAQIDNGIVPVIKHIPGHGRATADTHLHCAIVDTPLETLVASDFAVFSALADAPVAMTAHVTYTCLDAQRPATLSPDVITYVRQQIGFTGLLVSDCLHMQALGGSIRERIEQSLSADVDLVIDSHSDYASLNAQYQGLRISEQASQRLQQAMALWQPDITVPQDYQQLLQSFTSASEIDPTESL